MDIKKKLVITLSIEECNVIKLSLAKSVGLSWEQVNPVICEFDKQVMEQLKPVEEKSDGVKKDN